MANPNFIVDDRELQDEVIRYLTDARLRLTPSALPLPEKDADRAGKFAMFLARRYYRDRLQRSFRYSALFASQTHRKAQDAVEGESFAALMHESVLGSLSAAQRVGQMAAAYLSDGDSQPVGASREADISACGWWKPLLDYEYLHFLQTATSETFPKTQRPQRGVSAACHKFEWYMPELLERIREGRAPEDDLRREVTLLFARTDTGKIYVMETDRAAGGVFRATDGNRSADDIAAAAGLSSQETIRILESLAEVGAVGL